MRSAGVARHAKFQDSNKRTYRLSVPGLIWFFGLFFVVFSCLPNDNPASGNAPKPQPSASQTDPSVNSGLSMHREKIWTAFDGHQALAEAQTLTDFGPRPSGSEANKKVRQHLEDRLASLGWQTTEQKLTEQAPDGHEIEFCNLIARFAQSPTSPQRILIGAHFDTPAIQEFRDPGASDGGANTAVLLELARTLAAEPQLAANIELLFLDGAAPFRELTLSDGLFGSRFYAQMLHINQHAGDIRAAILLDNIGGATLNFLPNSDPNLASALKKAGLVVGIKLEPGNRALLADQVPFAQAGIPSIALLDVDSPYVNTADDTTDRLDEESLTKTGNLILCFVANERGTP